jgi:DNA topoisomerase-1
LTRLRTVSCQEPGWRRIRCGRGFRYVDQDGAALDDDAVARIRDLAIPPAWTEVWICPDDRGHLQAVGTDDAGRRQYIYHPVWREKRDAAKFERVVEMARKLPRVRKKLREAMSGPPTGYGQVLATAVHLIDLGCFRPGAEVYAEENGSYGLTTLERRHMRKEGDARVFCFVGKAGVDHEVRVVDADVCRVLDAVTRGRRPGSHLLSAREDGRWRSLNAADINGHIGDLFGLEVTAKDFRTWHATVTVAVALAEAPRAASRLARTQQMRAAIAEAAELLGNSPAVARSSYVDPRVLDRFESGQTVGRHKGRTAYETAVVRLLGG